MDNIVRTWEEVELTDEQLEVIYGGQATPATATFSGQVLGITVSGTGPVPVTAFNFTSTDGTNVTGNVTVGGSLGVTGS